MSENAAPEILSREDWMKAEAWATAGGSLSRKDDALMCRAFIAQRERIAELEAVKVQNRGLSEEICWLRKQAMSDDKDHREEIEPRNAVITCLGQDKDRLVAEVHRLTESRHAISALFPDDAPHKHAEAGVSLLDDVRDLIAERKRIAEERDADYQTKLLSLFDQHGVECDNCGVFLIARAGPDFQEDARGLTSAPEGEEESICGYCAGMELSALRAELAEAQLSVSGLKAMYLSAEQQRDSLRAELESVTAERDRQYEFNAGQIAKYAALQVEYAESVTALCFVRSRLIGLRHESCNDELHELSEELTGILSFIDAAISATTAGPEEKR